MDIKVGYSFGMLEIFALPYFAVSGVIGWVIFSPFFSANDFEALSPTQITTADLLAIAMPISIVFAIAKWVFPVGILSISVQAIVVAIAFLFAAVALTVGLFLLPKNLQITFFKRMTVIGIIAPSGILLTLGWVALLIWASAHSMLYLAPSSLAMAAAASGLRTLACWVCQSEPKAITTEPEVST